MACVTPSHCQPCTTCGQTPAGAPAEPACPPLPDGTYTNVTLVVEDGCIVSVQNGDAPLYSPDVCCAPVGVSGGGSGLDGEQGPPGVAATVSIGSVTSLGYGATPTVVNSGSPTNAILNFGIPRGEPGDDGESATGATSNLGGIDLDNGSIKDPLPGLWPPVLNVAFAPTGVAGVTLNATKDTGTGIVTLTVDLTAYDTMMDASFVAIDARIDPLEASINKPTSYTVLGAPSPVTAGAGSMIYVSNEVGGPVLAFSDGANWLRVTDRAIIS